MSPIPLGQSNQLFQMVVEGFMKIHSVVSGSLLEMTLEQRFRNPEERNVEVVYTFPLPWGAVLLGIEVLLNGQKHSGKVAARLTQTSTQYALSDEFSNTHSSSLALPTVASLTSCR